MIIPPWSLGVSSEGKPPASAVLDISFLDTLLGPEKPPPLVPTEAPTEPLFAIEELLVKILPPPPSLEEELPNFVVLSGEKKEDEATRLALIRDIILKRPTNKTLQKKYGFALEKIQELKTLLRSQGLIPCQKNGKWKPTDKALEAAREYKLGDRDIETLKALEFKEPSYLIQKVASRVLPPPALLPLYPPLSSEAPIVPEPLPPNKKQRTKEPADSPDSSDVDALEPVENPQEMGEKEQMFREIVLEKIHSHKLKKKWGHSKIERFKDELQREGLVPSGKKALNLTQEALDIAKTKYKLDPKEIEKLNSLSESERHRPGLRDLAKKGLLHELLFERTSDKFLANEWRASVGTIGKLKSELAREGLVPFPGQEDWGLTEEARILAQDKYHLTEQEIEALEFPDRRAKRKKRAPSSDPIALALANLPPPKSPVPLDEWTRADELRATSEVPLSLFFEPGEISLPELSNPSPLPTQAPPLRPLSPALPPPSQPSAQAPINRYLSKKLLLLTAVTGNLEKLTSERLIERIGEPMDKIMEELEKLRHRNILQKNVDPGKRRWAFFLAPNIFSLLGDLDMSPRELEQLEQYIATKEKRKKRDPLPAGPFFSQQTQSVTGPSDQNNLSQHPPIPPVPKKRRPARRQVPLNKVLSKKLILLTAQQGNLEKLDFPDLIKQIDAPMDKIVRELKKLRRLNILQQTGDPKEKFWAHFLGSNILPLLGDLNMSPKELALLQQYVAAEQRKKESEQMLSSAVDGWLELR